MSGGVHDGEERAKKKKLDRCISLKRMMSNASPTSFLVGTVSFNSRAATAAGVFLSLCVVFDTRS